MQNQRQDSDLVFFFRQARVRGDTPDKALYQYLLSLGMPALIPEPFRSLGRERIQPIKELLFYLASPEGSSWLRQGRNLENLLTYLASVL